MYSSRSGHKKYIVSAESVYKTSLGVNVWSGVVNLLLLFMKSLATVLIALPVLEIDHTVLIALLIPEIDHKSVTSAQTSHLSLLPSYS